MHLFFSPLILGVLLLSVLIYLIVRYVLNERQLFQLKYTFYVSLVMLYAIILPPLFALRPRNALNIRLAAVLLNPLLRLLGLKYRVENGQVLDNDKACVIVANHQSALDFTGMMHLWPKHVQYCTILAKKELIWAGPFGPSAWLAGVEYVDRKNRQRSADMMQHLIEKLRSKSLRLWVFPEGTRNMGETFLPFKLGAFRTAIEAQIPIVPIVFSSYRPIYNVDKANNSYYWRSGCVTIKCLDPIDTAGMTLDNDLQRLTELTRKRMLDAYLTIRTMPINDTLTGTGDPLESFCPARV